MLSPEELALADDSKYKQYSNSIDKALKNFETSNEWADLISALGKLAKALNPKYKAIPKKSLVGKRLAQCMHPALPGGVHIKALAVYSAIFEMLSKEQLAQDLYIYSTGIFPIYTTASMQVRPKLLTLVETHLVPLNQYLNVCLDGLMFGLLPGLEDGAEHFERLDNIFTKICAKVGRESFYSSVWHCVLSQSPARLSAIQLVTRHFDRKRATAYQSHILGNDLDLVVLALSDAVQDSNVLVQRAVLDFLTICFPFTATVISKEKFLTLLVSSLTCVLRRDMSLNRRLYTWLLGCDQTKLISNPSKSLRIKVQEYFGKNSKELLIRGINKLFAKQTNLIKSYRRTPGKVTQAMIVEQMFPLKIVTSLLDKNEVGPVILEEVLISIFRLLKVGVETSSKIEKDEKTPGTTSSSSFKKKSVAASSTNVKQQQNTSDPLSCSGEVLKNIKLFFSFIEEDVIWNFLVDRIKIMAATASDCDDDNNDENLDTKSVRSCSVYSGTNTNLAELCGFVSTLLGTLNLDGNLEVQTVWLPAISYSILTVLVQERPVLFGAHQVETALETCLLLLAHTQPQQFEDNCRNNNAAAASNFSTIEQENDCKEADNDHVFQNTVSNTVQDCYRLLQTFFVLFVRFRFNCTSADINNCLNDITLNDTEGAKEKLKPPALLVHKDESDYPRCADDPHRDSNNDSNASHTTRVFALACRLLLDYACFPVYNNNNNSSAACSSSKMKQLSSVSSVGGLKVSELTNRRCLTPPPMNLAKKQQRHVGFVPLKRSRSQSPIATDNSPQSDRNYKPASTMLFMANDKTGSLQQNSEPLPAKTALVKVLQHYSKPASSSGNVVPAKLSERLADKWVTSLLWTCCGYFSHDDNKTLFQIFASSISAALDLIASAYNSSSNLSDKNEKATMQLLSNFTAAEADFITYHTKFYAHVSGILWKVLGCKRHGSSHLSAVRLLTRCHSICPNSWCEDVILAEMLSFDKKVRVPAIEKFCRMWHLIRSCRNSRLVANDLSKIKTFSRCLFALVDHLSQGGDRESTISHRADDATTTMIGLHHGGCSSGISNSSVMVNCWLRQCLDVRDLGRILEPYLLVLLNAKTHSVPLKSDRLFFSKPKKTLGEVITMDDQQTLRAGFNNELKSAAVTPCESVEEPSQNVVHQDIAKTKSEYKNLVSELMLSPTTEEEEVDTTTTTSASCVLHDIAQQIVADAIIAGYDQFKIDVANKPLPEICVDEIEDSKASTPNCKQQQHEMWETETDISECSRVSFIGDDEPNGGGGADNDEYKSSMEDLKHVSTSTLNTEINTNEHRMLSYGYIYQETFNAKQVVYCLRSILNLLRTQPRPFTYASSTTQLSSVQLCTDTGFLQEMLARHEQSHAGSSFYGNIKKRLKSQMMVDVLIGVCLHYIRSWPQLDCDDVTLSDVHEIRYVACQLLVALLAELRCIATEKSNEKLHNSAAVLLQRPTSLSINVSLPPILPSASSADLPKFAAYLTSILDKHHVAAITLRSLASTIVAMQSQDLDEQVSPFNYSPIASKTNLPNVQWWCGNDRYRVQSFQTLLLTLLHTLLLIEEHNESSTGKLSSSPTTENLTVSKDLTRMKYNPDEVLSRQPLLASCLINVLSSEELRLVQPAWMEFLTASLSSLAPHFHVLATPLVLALCNNIEEASNVFEFAATAGNILMCAKLGDMPPDYLVICLKTLRVFIHTLLPISGSPGRHGGSPSTSQSTTPSSWVNVFNVFGTPQKNFKGDDTSVNPIVLHMQTVVMEVLPRMLTCFSLIWNRVVVSKPPSSQSTSTYNKNSPPPPQQISLDMFDNVIHPSSVLGSVDVVSKHLLQLLNPFVIQYGENLIAAIAIVWEKQSRSIKPSTKKSPTKKHQQDASPADPDSFNAASSRVTESQNNLLRFVASLTCLRCDRTIKLVKKVILQPPQYPKPDADCETSLQVSLLQFTLGYIRLQSTATLLESRGSIINLIREYLSSQGPAQTPSNTSTTNHNNTTVKIVDSWQRSSRSIFFLLLMLFETVRRLPAIEDKKQQKDLQEVSQKCVEACNAIVESSLEHGGWLARRVAAVVPESSMTPSNSTVNSKSTTNGIMLSATNSETFFPSPTSSSELIADNDSYLDVASSAAKHETLSIYDASYSLPNNTSLALNKITNKNKVFQLSIQAITVLSQVLANLLDLVFASEEKDKIVPILTPVIANVTPYLKNRKAANTPAYYAAVKLLASVCGYQQTRRAWKKEVSELFFDSGFFHMPLDCVTAWRTVIEHLMTHDTTTFKDLMGRLGVMRSTTGASSLNIFSSKDQEHELRASMLKRVTFVLFSSDVNQFRSHLPEIQERLAESLRLHHVPTIQRQVFLCFRVLLLRVLPGNLTSLWPSMLTELYQIFLRIEADIASNSLIDEHKKTFNPGSVHQKLQKCHQNSTNNSSNGHFNIAPIPSSNTNNSSGGKALKAKQLALYLSVCKLLDLLLILQPDRLPHFKLFLWSFVGKTGANPSEREDVIDAENWLQIIGKDASATATDPSSATTTAKRNKKTSSNKNFVPLCLRIRQLLAEKHPAGEGATLTPVPLRPLLTQRSISSLIQLQAFFNTITSPQTMLRYHRRRIDISKKKEEDGRKPINLSDILALLERDFAESL